MPTYNPKQRGEPEIIREINPTVLCAFLKPFDGYLRTRGLEVKEPSRIDNAAIEKLVDILINPTMKTPQRLLNAVFYVEEMSTPLAADSLLTRAQQAGMPFDEEATSFNEPARHEKLGDERQAILDQIKSAQGLGGRVRQKFDAERSRKTVCKAISRSIEAIEKVHPELGLHFHKSINLGLEVSYSPDVVIDWLF